MFRYEFNNILQNLLNSYKNSPKELGQLAQDLHKIIDQNISSCLAKQVEIPLEHIEADEITLEIVDKHSGLSFRRTLPIKYEENDNGLVLQGENMAGKPSEIVFLTDKSLGKIKDLTGHGADKPRCD